MTPFQQFRLWARRAPGAERTAAIAAAILMLSALGWLIAPSTTRGSASLSLAGAPPSTGPAASRGQSQGAAASADTVPAGAAAGPGVDGGGSGPSAAAVSGGPASQAPTGGATQSGVTRSGGQAGQGANPASSGAGSTNHCVAPPGTDQGVAGKQVRIAVLLVNVAGPASTAVGGFPTPAVQQQYFQQVIDSVNAQTGAGCRSIAADFFSPNIADQSSLQQTCLQIEQGGYFSVLDVGSYFLFPTLASCFPQNHIPYFGGAVLPAKEQAQYFPYLFGTSLAEPGYRNAVDALKQRGFFDHASGFTKLGLVYRDCEPEYLTEVEDDLAKVGVSTSDVVAYDLGCSAVLYAPPSDIEGAVLKFQQTGVHNVTFINDINDFANFTTIAQQQGFKPKYGFPDDGIVAGSSGTGNYNSQNMDGMVVITMHRWGEQTTPGTAPSTATQACNAVFTRNHEPPVYQQGDGAGGVACDMIWEFAAAVDHAPALQRNALAAGLHAAGSVPFSFPWGPNDFTTPNTTTGGEFWRPVQFAANCHCWHVLDPTFHPPFP